MTPIQPDLNAILEQIADAGQRLSEINANEGASGNISVYSEFPLAPEALFPETETLNLPITVPDLAGRSIVVTGSGRRLRELRQDPLGNLGVVVIRDGGRQATLYTSPKRRFQQLTSEFNSHLAVHREQVARTHAPLHAVIHAQPVHLTYLSHIDAYRDELYINRRLLRWQPETIVQLPDGVGVVPFLPGGSPELMRATVQSLETHTLTLWSKHGVMARSEASARHAVDIIEYAETAARFEFMNLGAGGRASGLAIEEIREVVRTHNLTQVFF
ncbi:MAG: class II aldolase/adducin family protein [Fibrobacterota bacterium]